MTDDSLLLDAAAAAALEHELRDERTSDEEIIATVRERLRPVYALVRILPRFEVGDRLDLKLAPVTLAGLVARGDASHTKPAEPEALATPSSALGTAAAHSFTKFESHRGHPQGGGER